MLLTWVRVGIALRFVEWAMFSPLATMPPAAFTIFSAVAFASAESARVTL
jgi:hypothetical protein